MPKKKKIKKTIHNGGSKGQKSSIWKKKTKISLNMLHLVRIIQIYVLNHVFDTIQEIFSKISLDK